MNILTFSVLLCHGLLHVKLSPLQISFNLIEYSVERVFSTDITDSTDVCVCVCVCGVGGTSRASGMLLHYKPMGSQDAQQLRMEVADDKKVASLWLVAMHKVQ